MANKNILLIEPGYRNKYPPLGLMKIAQYHGPTGKQDNVQFVKGEDKSVLEQAWDRIYVTSLFSFEWKRTARAIDFAIAAASGQTSKVFVGGIAASLMHERYCSQDKWRGVRFIKGLLNQPPAESLQLDEFEEELYASDCSSPPIENLTPDYSILEQTDYVYPVTDAYFVYASRGCTRKCTFCGVPTLEGDLYESPSITKIVNDIEQRYGAKKDLILMDNNVVASPKFREIAAEIRDLGFARDATLKRGRHNVQRRVDFNQGVDARILSKDPMYLEELSTLCIKPLRIAFDHLGLKKPYKKAIEIAHANGLHELSNYMLYNFQDDPKDLFERMWLNLELNEKLDIRIFSFPMRYQPIDRPDRGHVGESWTKYQLRSLQIMLQATHGVVSGAPEFFRQAYGDSPDAFLEILSRPQHFIFNRMWYEKYDGRGEFDEFMAIKKRLTPSENDELIRFLSEHDKNNYEADSGLLGGDNLRKIIRFYAPLEKGREREIWDTQKARNEDAKESILELISPDEFVEDAGLNETENDDELISKPVGLVA